MKITEGHEKVSQRNLLAARKAEVLSSLHGFYAKVILPLFPSEPTQDKKIALPRPHEENRMPQYRD